MFTCRRRRGFRWWKLRCSNRDWSVKDRVWSDFYDRNLHLKGFIFCCAENVTEDWRVTLLTELKLCIKPTLFGLLRTTICVTLAAPLAGSMSPLGAFMCNWTLWGGSHGTLKFNAPQKLTLKMYLHSLPWCPSLWTWQGLNGAGGCHVTVRWKCYSSSHLGDKH